MNTEKLSIPAAIIVAGLIIAVAVFARGGGQASMSSKNEKSIAAKAGLNEKKLQVCAATDSYKEKIQAGSESGGRAMSLLAEDMRGTPYNVVYDVKTGVKIQLPGAYPHDAFKQAIDQLIAGTAKGEAINLDPITATDHFYGNKNAEVVIVEYGDLECPYCATVHPTIQKIITEYDGKVAWVFRHFPLSIHANAHIKAQAAECAWEQGGDEAFFKYLDATYSAIEEQINPKFDTSTL
jgi:protein-disulfide isomerase